MLTLAKILENEKILNEIKFVDSDEYAPIKEIVSLVKDSEKNSIALNFMDEVGDKTFLTMDLYFDEGKKVYLLESKVNWHFETEKDTYSACLLVFDENLNLISEEIDDVESYANWVALDEIKGSSNKLCVHSIPKCIIENM